MSLNDYEVALKLQSELDEESNESFHHEVNDKIVEPQPENSRKRPYSEFDLNGTQQIVHPLWETLDPTPDIFGMFKGFDIKFFQGKLNCVELEWSKRMYTCAGICYQRKNRFGKACTIRLSEPLLKLRSRKNLVETLLHEMIHAYLFILNVREGNGGHGPNFKRIMVNINKAAGTNITVYHTFHDEVHFYKTHIWRCGGICQHRGPFFGYVRRTSNRAPGPNDQWWAHHQEQCGGHFLKVSEPDPAPKQRKGKPNSTSVTNGSKIDNPRWGMVKKTTPTGTAAKVSTITVRKGAKTASKTIDAGANASAAGHLTPDLSAGHSLSNVVGFKDLNENATNPSQNSKKSFPSSGHVLGKPAKSNSPVSRSSEPRANVRDIWNKKYTATSTTTSSASSSSNDQPQNSEVKRAKFDYTPFKSNWERIDDDIQVENVVYETVTILDEVPKPPVVKQSSGESQQTIKREIMDSFGEDITDSDIELIDCDYDDDVEAPSNNLCDKTITDNLFSWNKSTEDLNSIQMSDPENVGNPDKELVSCPVCQIKCERELMSDHLDGCFGSTRKIDPKRAVKPPTKGSKNVKINESMDRGGMQFSVGSNFRGVVPDHFKRKNRSSKETNEEREYNERILRELELESRSSSQPSSAQIDTVDIDDDDDVPDNTVCPVCSVSVEISKINDHLDICLSI